MTSIQRHGAAALFASLLTAAVAVTGAQAQATNLGSFNDWTAWQGSDANGVICYISSAPTDTEPKNVNRDPIHFLVIHRKGLGTKNEVQTLIGYPFNSTSANATATVDGKAYPMVAEGAAAWLASTGDEGGFVAALKAGTRLVVKGTSQRGTNTTDTYSLRGVTAAMTEIDKACA
jgi:Invasion associated locus B (IalB) protein